MYMSIPRGLPPLSTENAREIVDALDELIKIRVQMRTLGYSYQEEQCELIKRRITDYLLMTDPRGGVYQTGKDPR